MAPKLRRRTFASDDIVVGYDLRRCIHAEECVRGLPAVFDPKKRPWIRPEKATAEEVASTVLRCPTGALSFERLDGGDAEQKPTENIILVVPDGPLHVHGDVEITTPEGELLHRDTRLALCRCGASRNKPFCDNSHLDIDFRADGSVGEYLDDAAEDPEGSTLRVVSRPNGPFHLRGAVEVRGAKGQKVSCRAEAWLCRCGNSANKPFCDGTHRKIGFTAETW